MASTTIRRPSTPSTVPSAIGSTRVRDGAPNDGSDAGSEVVVAVGDVEFDVVVDVLVVVVKSSGSSAV
jgi:hypothetical protein